VDKEWQRSVCARLGLQFCNEARLNPGGPNIPIKRPDLRTVRRIVGDGNCLFRSFSYVITGSQDQHMAVRTAILTHMRSIYHLLLDQGVIPENLYSSVQEYISEQSLDEPGSWGSEVETFTFAHLLQTPILTYDKSNAMWQRVAPVNVDPTLNDDLTQMSMYLIRSGNHYEVVSSIRKNL